MAKLERLSELLVSEINEFEKGVEKLQEIQQQKFAVDSRQLQQVLKQHQERFEEVSARHIHKMNTLGQKLDKTKAYPVWVLTLVIASFILNGILLYGLLF
ncbi:DUF6730 family protein [Salegentibacter sp. F14]